MKKLMQVDLSSLATPVEKKKRVYKKRKVEEVEEERPSTGGKSIKSFTVKEKKPPTEKQLAARERMKQARLEKIERVKAEKAKLDEEIRLKQEEVDRKKAELAERRRLKREEKKKLLPQKPIIQSPPGEVGTVEDKGPTISQVLKSLPTSNVEKVEQENVSFEEPVDNEILETPTPQTPKNNNVQLQVPPPAPKRTYQQRVRNFAFGKPIPMKPRFR